MSGKGDSKEAVYKYLKSQNRPYSANDILQNLHNEYGKTSIQKALDDLTRDNKIREKTYGKQKIYSIIQEESDESNPQEMENELMEIDSKIELISDGLAKMEGELKVNESALKDIKRRPNMEDCVREKKELQDEVKILTEKVQYLAKNDVNISEKERNQVQKDSEVYVREYKKRKRICMDILNSILENCSKPKKALFEEIGIETDEDVSFKLPTF